MILFSLYHLFLFSCLQISNTVCIVIVSAREFLITLHKDRHTSLTIITRNLGKSAQRSNMDPKTNETPLLTKLLRRFKGQSDKNKRCTKYSPANCSTDRQNDINHVTGDSHASSPCGCHCVASRQKSLDEKYFSDSLVRSKFPVSKSCIDPQFSFPETFCPNSIVMHEGYSSLCELLDQCHRSSPSTATPTKPCKRDSQIQTDPLPNLPPLGSQEQIMLINKNTSPAQSPRLYSSQIAEKQCPIPTGKTQRESFDQTTSSGYSTCSFDRKTSASRTHSYPSLPQDAPLSPCMGNSRFDYRLRTSSCMLVSPTRSDASQPSEFQPNIMSTDREHWDQESSSVSTGFGSRPSRTQSQSTPTHENHHDDFVVPDHRRRSLSDSYACEALRGAKRSEKMLKMRRNGSDGKNGSFSPGLISPYREDKLKNTHAFEDKLSKKTAFSTFLDKMPKLSLLKRFKEKSLQYESVPDLSKFGTPKTTRRLKSICRNVRSHEQLDQEGMRHYRACLVSSSKTQGSSPQHSDCGYIDPDTVSRNFSKKNALNLTKSVRKTMSINSIDTTVRNVTGGSVDTTPFHRSALHSPSPRSSILADVVGHQDSDEFYMTFDPDLNPPCLQTAESFETPLMIRRPIRQSNGIASDNQRLDQNGQGSRYERRGNAAEDDIGHKTTSKSCSSIVSIHYELYSDHRAERIRQRLKKYIYSFLLIRRLRSNECKSTEV